MRTLRLDGNFIIADLLGREVSNMTSSLLFTKPWRTPLGRPVQVINYLELKQGSGPEEEGEKSGYLPYKV